MVGEGFLTEAKQFENPLDIPIIAGNILLYLAVVLFALFLVAATRQQSWFWKLFVLITLVPVVILFKEFALRPKMVTIHENGVRLVYWT